MKTFTKNFRLKTGYFSMLLMTLLLIGASLTEANAQTCPLACNDNVQVSLDTNCLAVITPDIILEDPGVGCTYVVEVYDKFGNIIPNATITKEFVGQTLTVAVFLGSNSCWGSLSIEDKYPPQVVCPDADTIFCHMFTGPDAYNWPAATVYDSCGTVTEVVVSTEFEDWDCRDLQGGVLEFSGIWKRTCYWVDESGNASDICVKEVYLKRATCADVVFPSDTVFACTDYKLNTTLTNPENAGLPSINGVPLYFPNGQNKYFACEMNITFTDDTIFVCPGTFKIIRKWICVDWCYPSGTNPQNPREEYQIIKVADVGLQVSAPSTCPPSNLNGDIDEIKKYSDVIGMNYWACTSTNFLLPNPLTDPRFFVAACSDVTYTVGVRTAVDPEDCSGATNAEVVNPYITKSGDDFYANELPQGYSWIVYHFEDECGNSQEAKYDVYVYDDVPPSPVCDEHTVVSLNVDGIAKAFAKTFDDGSVDNCEVDHFEVRRMTDACGINGNTAFGPYVEFCCEDLMKTILVEFKVVDKRGNFNICMVEVKVQDKLAPQVVCPPNATVSCEFDLDDLSIFGTIRNKRKNEVREKLAGANNKGIQWEQGKELIDGYYYDNDNCNVKFTVKVTEVPYDCHTNTGYVKRTFTATDKSGNSTSCTQTITLRENNRFEMSASAWQKVSDYNSLKGCADYDELAPDKNKPWGAMTPSIAAQGRPGCYSLAVRYEDKVFNLGSDACLKIVRKWTVIDWCQFDRNNDECGAPGVWCHTQILKVIDNTPPEFTCDSIDVDTLNEYDCMSDEFTARRKVSLSADANDNCSNDKLKWNYTIEVKEDGGVCQAGSHDGSGVWTRFGRGTKNNVSGFFPFGEYRITWEVEDQCGNVSVCKNHYFDVLDRKLPTPYCRNGINTTVMPSSGSVPIWAKDFNLGSWDNCQEDTRVTFKLQLLLPDGSPTNRWSNVKGDFVLDCALVGKQLFRMWVYDQCGNGDYCVVTLDLQDPTGVCGNVVSVGIGGNITDKNDNDVPRVRVNLDLLSTNTTAYRMASGTYSFDILPMDNNYMIRPVKNDDPLNGVSTRDLVYIQKHLLGHSEFTTPEEFIAGDATNDNKVSTADISELRKLILGKLDDFRNGQKSWRFFDKSFVFDNPREPFSYPETIEYNSISRNEMNTNFTGVKIGDLNGDVDMKLNGSVKTRSTIEMVSQNVRFVEGEEVSLTFAVDAEGLLEGYQFTLDFDAAKLEMLDVVDGAISLNDDNFNYANLDRGVITTSWFNVDGVELDEDNLFTIQFVAKDNGNLQDVVAINSDVTIAELYIEGQATATVGLRFEGETGVKFELYQNRPNPFAQTTVIGFNLPTDGKALLTIYNLDGKVIKVINDSYSKGYNEININKSELSSSGVLYYQLDAEEYTSTRKMVIIK